MSDVAARLRTAVPTHAPIAIAWNGSDAATSDANLVHQVETRRLAQGIWSSWAPLATNTGIDQLNTWLPYERYVQFRVRTRNQAGLWSAWANATPFRVMAVRTPSFRLAGSWSTVSGNSWGIVRRSYKPGSAATLNFTGTAVGAVLRAAAGQGTVLACVDLGTAHAACQTINLATFSPTNGRVIAAAFNDLAPGGHVLRVSVVAGSVDLLGAVVKTAQGA
jgi:hypothetical protein